MCTGSPVHYEATVGLSCEGRGVHGPAATATASDDSSASAALQGPPTPLPRHLNHTGCSYIIVRRMRRVRTGTLVHYEQTARLG